MTPKQNKFSAYYRFQLDKLIKFLVPAGKKVFEVNSTSNFQTNEKYDYVIMPDLIGRLNDVWLVFRQLRQVTDYGSRVIVTYYSYFWDPVIRLAEIIGLKEKQNHQNWLSLASIENILDLNGFEVIKKGRRLFGLIEYLVAQRCKDRVGTESSQYSCSVVIPCKNEAGNIEGAVLRTPDMGSHTELIFVDGNSTDGTIEKIEELINKYKGIKDIKLIHQGLGKGKGDAVRRGFAVASGDILIILDADLTVPPEDLPKFYTALAEGRGQFINGTRLVYPMEKEAMRFLNKIANAFFGMVFTWLLGQRITDTLCGTKALFKKDYLDIENGRSYFGNFDPFGDFDLLFGASKINLKIVEMPIRYKQRVYGDIKIERFKHGLLLLKMSFIAFRKLKLV